MKKRLTISVAVCLVWGLSGCTSYSVPQPQAGENCYSLLNDPYFTFLPSEDKKQNPKGYFDEVVAAQEKYLQKIHSLIPADDQEKQLLGNLFDLNKGLLDIYLEEDLNRTAGQTALEYQQSLTETQFNAWQERGKKAQALTTQARAAEQAYADYCGAE